MLRQFDKNQLVKSRLVKYQLVKYIKTVNWSIVNSSKIYSSNNQLVKRLDTSKTLGNTERKDSPGPHQEFRCFSNLKSDRTHQIWASQIDMEEIQQCTTIHWCHKQPSFSATSPVSFLQKHGSSKKVHFGKLCRTSFSKKSGTLDAPDARMTSPPIFRKADQKPKVPQLSEVQ